MKLLTFCIIGLGSMGKRRARLLKQLNENYQLVGVDTRIDRREEFKGLFSCDVFSDIATALSNKICTAVFICTSPMSHSNIKSQVDKYKLHTFSEINLLSDGYDDVIDMDNTRSFLSSTQLYTKEISTLMTIIDKKDVYFYTYHVGQYLHDWHPWDKQEEFFVFNKDTNGCREILAIQLPWIVECFGAVDKVKTVSGKFTSMNIAFPDVYTIILQHANGSIGCLTVDVVARNPINDLKIQNETTLIEWNGEPNSLKVFNLQDKKFDVLQLYEKITHSNNYSVKIIEEPYLEEIKDFLKGVEDCDHQFKYSYKKDAYIINLLDLIEGKHE
ncbi:Gfo/Idh/MocA family oxidoreductase [Treponema pedis]|uniref:Gfo/Idh/MocA family oxidoreductase n=1 Tax=Treponema pedis TaxID=409322 RepID=UPI00040B32E0|nr:Gfo/Idh/MocA family oxidoreductase [Treponema pedis]